MNISSTTPVTSSTDMYSGATAAEVADRQRTVHAINNVNEANIFGSDRELTFTVDRATRRLVIQVIDRETRETVMQLPPEYVLRLAQNLQGQGH